LRRRKSRMIFRSLLPKQFLHRELPIRAAQPLRMRRNFRQLWRRQRFISLRRKQHALLPLPVYKRVGPQRIALFGELPSRARSKWGSNQLKSEGNLSRSLLPVGAATQTISGTNQPLTHSSMCCRSASPSSSSRYEGREWLAAWASADSCVIRRNPIRSRRKGEVIQRFLNFPLVLSRVPL